MAKLFYDRAPTWGVGGRRFKSSRADQKYIENQPLMAGFLFKKNHDGETMK
jgi:hypothetical protein